MLSWDSREQSLSKMEVWFVMICMKISMTPPRTTRHFDVDLFPVLLYCTLLCPGPTWVVPGLRGRGHPQSKQKTHVVHGGLTSW